MMLNQQPPRDPNVEYQREVMRVQQPPSLFGPDAMPYEVTFCFADWDLRDLFRAILKSGGVCDLFDKPAVLVQLVDPPMEVR